MAASGFAVEQFGFLTLTRNDRATWQGAVVSMDPGAWSAELPACGSAAAAGAFLCVSGLP